MPPARYGTFQWTYPLLEPGENSLGNTKPRACCVVILDKGNPTDGSGRKAKDRHWGGSRAAERICGFASGTRSMDVPDAVEAQST